MGLMEANDNSVLELLSAVICDWLSLLCYVQSSHCLAWSLHPTSSFFLYCIFITLAHRNLGKVLFSIACEYVLQHNEGLGL